MDINKTYTGHNIDVMSTFPDKCIDCIITSPPYYQLRNYKTEHQIWGDGWKGELGLEPTYQMYIEHLIMVFSECKRVLKDEGTLWVNLGDSYSGSGNDSGKKEGSISQQITKQKVGIANPMHAQPKQSLQSKCLLNIPSRFRIAMTDQLGFIQRNNIIWYKNNCMPSSATDRFTVDFEDIMFFTKKKNYYFEQQFEKTQAIVIENRMKEEKTETYNAKYKNANVRGTMNRNMRTVWNVNTSGSKDKHYAMYPEKLLVRMIEAGCPKGGIVLDPFGGSGTTGITAKKLQRNFINIELNPEYSEIAINKYHNTIGDLF